MTPSIDPTVELFDHQKKAVDFFLEHDGKAAVFYEMGLGKTLLALKAYSHYDNMKLMVFCPLSLIEGAWGEDIAKFTNYTYCNGHDKIKDADIYLFNYESLNSKKKYAQILRLLDKGNWMCVLDESSRIKNHKAQTTKKLHALRWKFSKRMILSGTPAPNIETEYWSQMNFVDDIFDKSFYKFQRTYFHMSRGGHREDVSGFRLADMLRKGFKLSISDHNREVLMSVIKQRAIYAKKQDCLDLPDRIYEKRYVNLTGEYKKIYNTMKKDMILTIENDHIVAQSALTLLMKLRQITGGFAMSHDGATVALNNSKLSELENVIEEAGNQKVIIWCQFKWEIKRIKELIGEKAVCLYGETKDKQGVIDAFKTDKQYLIAHPRSAGHGLTFTECSLQVFYSLDYSWETYEQAKARTHRAGQKNNCTYIHLLAKDTIDDVIYDALMKKKSNDELLYELMR